MGRKPNRVPKQRNEYDDEIVEMYTCKRQYSQRAIAESLDISTDFVRERLRAKNVVMRGRSEALTGRVVTTERRREILFWHKEGLDTTQIAEKVGCSSSNVITHLKREGVKLTHHKKKCKHGHDLTKKAYYIEKEKKDTKTGYIYTVRICRKCYARWHSKEARARRAAK